MRRSVLDQATVLIAAGALCVALAAAMAVMTAYNKPTYAVLAAATATGGFLALCSNVAALCLLIVVASLDGFTKALLPGMLSMLFKDILLGVMLVRWIWEGLNHHPRPSLRHPLALPTFLFVAWCTGQMFNSETGSYLAALAGLRSWIASPLVFFVAHDTLAKRHHARLVGWWAVVVGAGTSVYGIIQQQIGYEHLYSLSPNFGHYVHYGARAASTYVAPGVFGLAAALSASLAVGLGLSGPLRRGAPLIGAVGAVLCGMGVAASGSRGPLLATLFCLGAFALFSRRPQLIAVVVIVALVGLWQSQKYVGGLMEARFTGGMLSKETIISRVVFPLQVGWKSMVKNPLGTGVASGLGLGRAVAYVDQPVMVKSTAAAFIENELGRAMKELGFPGAFLFVWFIWRTLTSSFSGWRLTRGRTRWFSAGMFATVIGCLPTLGIGQMLYLASPAILFWYAAAAASRSPEYSEQLEQDEATEAARDTRTSEQINEWNRMLRRAGYQRGDTIARTGP